jgi:hypothetical protein
MSDVSEEYLGLQPLGNVSVYKGSKPENRTPWWSNSGPDAIVMYIFYKIKYAQ